MTAEDHAEVAAEGADLVDRLRAQIAECRALAATFHDPIIRATLEEECVRAEEAATRCKHLVIWHLARVVAAAADARGGA